MLLLEVLRKRAPERLTITAVLKRYTRVVGSEESVELRSRG